MSPVFPRHTIIGLFGFMLISGAAFAAGADGADGRAANAQPASAAAKVVVRNATDSSSVSRRDNPNAPSPNDVVTADDIIVQGSACIGLDCVNNESFGFDTLRLKENNTRIRFMDTSASAGFANHNWQLTANDSGSGGLEKFSIEDLTAATVPFTVLGSAPSNALFVDASGRVGLRTGTPQLDLHIYTGDTPAIRFDQNGGGFTAQSWDIGANEANFFVRDLTGGSRLPFRIRPGAPTSSIDIAASGNVGVGTASPAAKLDVMGDMLVHGTISQLSSRTAKEHFAEIDGKLVLAKLDALPISTWNYRGADSGDRHLGPVAEDFHAAFGLGPSDHFVAPNDVAGVALASVKALQQEVRARDQRIEALESRLSELEDLVRHRDR
ncbi:MAG: tail fiber domain-containing protein [Dokdonella sp.]